MGHRTDGDVRDMVERELGQRRSTAPGLLAAWGPSGGRGPFKEVIAIIRPARWTATKARVQRMRVFAFTQHRVLGRGSEGGLYQRQAAQEAAVPYLPKRLVSWIVEAPLVEPLVQAIIAENHTGQPGDGKIFVLPVEEAVRLRTGERGMDALKPEYQHETVVGTTREESS